MFPDIISNFVVNIAILMIIGYLMPRASFFRRTVFEHQKLTREKVLLGLIFGAIGILATYTGIRINGAIVNTRVIGVIAGGFLGGPIVGIIAGLVAGLHRYAIDINGFTGLACAISTIVEGLIGGFMYKRVRSSKRKYRIIFATTFIAEIIQMIIILLIARPFVDAVELVRIIALPMIILNSIGIVVFLESMYSVQRSLDQHSAVHMKLAFDLAQMCLPYLRKGILHEESMAKSANIIYKNIDATAVLITNNEKVLANAGENIEDLPQFPIFFHYEFQRCMLKKKTIMLNEEDLKKYQMNHTFKRVLIAPLMRSDQIIGTLAICDKKFKEKLEADREFINGLSSLFSSQLELSEIDYQKKLLEKAELRALQYQINPHFLFNALNTISAYCRENPDRARTLLLALSSYFRNTLSTHKEMVDIHEEIEHVLSYLEIEKARFEDRLQVNIDVSPDLHFMVPNFIVQPLIENAIKHGMKSPLLVVDVKIEEKKEGLSIIIRDNGGGIQKHIVEKLYNGNHDKDKIGLANTHHRLKSIYPNNAGLLIESKPSLGTQISMLIPRAGA
jgi:two-component system, LytTR family, sensor histidine kinase LytS